jgi:hypothetical protein
MTRHKIQLNEKTNHWLKDVLLTSIQKLIPEKLKDHVEEIELTEVTIAAKLTIYYEVDLVETAPEETPE